MKRFNLENPDTILPYYSFYLTATEPVMLG